MLQEPIEERQSGRASLEMAGPHFSRQWEFPVRNLAIKTNSPFPSLLETVRGRLSPLTPTTKGVHVLIHRTGGYMLPYMGRGGGRGTLERLAWINQTGPK